jgi:hypothetical protein
VSHDLDRLTDKQPAHTHHVFDIPEELADYCGVSSPPDGITGRKGAVGMKEATCTYVLSRDRKSEPELNQANRQ